MQDEQQPSETLNVSGGEVEKNRFDGNSAPIFKDVSGSVTINHNYAASYSKNIIESSNLTQIECNLNELLAQKRELEIQLESVRSKINQILKEKTDPKLINSLNWLADRHQLAEKYGKRVLRDFRDLKQEAEEKGSLDDFFFQVERYLELVEFSLRYDNKIFLQEPAIYPTFADPDMYVYASTDIYKEVFRILKESIPKSNVDVSMRSKLEDHFDELLERLQTYL